MQVSPDVGRTFGRVADAYERTRPEYPREAVDRAARELGLTPDATLLDLAAGTGKLTRRLRERFARVVAVEPDDEMRGRIGGDARAGTAESVPLPDAAVDAVFVGDAFHWFEPEPALAEIVRVLRPGGGLALLWNRWWEGEQPPLPAEFREVLDELWERFRPSRRENAEWRESLARSPFGPLGEARFGESRRVSGRELVDLTLTASGPAALADAERLAVAERMYRLMEPEYALAVATDVYWTRLP